MKTDTRPTSNKTGQEEKIEYMTGMKKKRLHITGKKMRN